MAIVLDAILTACLAVTAIGVFGILAFSIVYVTVSDLRNRRAKRAEDKRNNNDGL